VDQELLVSAQLTSEMLRAGEDLVLELDRRKFAMKAALWLYMEEPDEWRLVIATPHRRSMGLLPAYKWLQELMSEIETPIDLSSVALVDTKDSLVKGLSKFLRARSGAAGVRLSHSIINGRFVEDAYIYRLAA
jgi:hypothetical protein